MASTLVLFLLFFFMLFTIEATNTTNEKHDSSSIIGLGSLLYPKGKNSSWPSSSGHFAFGFYPKGSGFAVGIWLVGPSDNTTTVVWTANRDAPAVSSKSMLNLTEQGLLLLQNGTGDPPLYIIDFSRDGSDSNSYTELVSRASMLDSGNFVLYDEHSNVIWQSFDDPTDTILGGQNMTNYLVSSMSKSDHSSGRFYLGRQSDGNVAAYPFYSFRSDEDAYWDSNSNTSFGYHQKLSLSIQGSLCLTNSETESCKDSYCSRRVSSSRLTTDSESNGRVSACPSGRILFGTSCIPGNYGTRSSTNTLTHYRLCFNNDNKSGKKLHKNITSIYRATLDVDGNLRLYEHQLHFEKGNNSSRVVMLWQALNDTCLVKGFCGMNSYCSSNMNGDTACKCYPGFVQFPSKTKSSPNMAMDCVQILSKDDCEKSEDRTLLYNFTHFKNMYWGDIPYSVIPVLKMETCVEACQQDCVCVGAVYTNGSCNKYRLPLIYGRVQNDSSTVSVALLKIPSSTIAVISPPTSNDTNMPKPKCPFSSLTGVKLIAGQLNKLIKQDEKDVDWKILERMVKVGLWCVQDQQSLRPTMKNVILMLEGLKDIPVPPPPTRLLE
ncbi:hypothetical protein P8452_72208 [Trifolium repens]|nr:hypothetical protein P8452_72208 [Trifolium repens]